MAEQNKPNQGQNPQGNQPGQGGQQQWQNPRSGTERDPSRNPNEQGAGRPGQQQDDQQRRQQGSQDQNRPKTDRDR